MGQCIRATTRPTEYMCTKFGVDSSSRFSLERGQTDEQTDATARPTHAGAYTLQPAWVTRGLRIPNT